MKYILASALVMATVLISGQISINFQHHLNLPPMTMNPNSIRTQHFISSDSFMFVGTQYDIFLKDSLMSHTSISDLETQVFYNAQKGDKIIFHLAGFGGAVDVYARLIDLVKNTKADTTMIVEGPVYSGHAFLALSGNHIKVLPLSFLMLHTYSSYGADCSIVKGTDRTQPMSELCSRTEAAFADLTNKILNNLPFVTSEELQQIETGHTVFISPEQIKERQGTKE